MASYLVPDGLRIMSSFKMELRRFRPIGDSCSILARMRSLSNQEEMKV
jgi:hypothetical protein